MNRAFWWRLADRATEPGPLVAGGAVAAIVLATGLPLLLAPLVGVAIACGVAAPAARAMVSAPRPERRPTVPLTGRWAAHVAEAESDRRRYDDAVASVADPAVRAGLTAVGDRLGAVVDSVRKVSAQGQQLEHAVAKLPDPEALDAELDDLHRFGGSEKRIAALTYQRDLALRVRRRVAEVEDRLAEMDAQLDTAVVQAIEAGLAADEPSVVADLGASIDAALVELDALNAALVEVAEVDDLT